MEKIKLAAENVSVLNWWGIHKIFRGGFSYCACLRDFNFFFWSVLCLFPRIATLREQIVCFPFRKLWDGLFSFDLVFLCNLSMSCYYPEDIFIVFLWYLPGQNKSSYSLRLNQWDWRGWNSNRCNIYTWTFAWLKILSEISVKKTIGVVNEIKHGQILRWRKLVS